MVWGSFTVSTSFGFRYDPMQDHSTEKYRQDDELRPQALLENRIPLRNGIEAYGGVTSETIMIDD